MIKKMMVALGIITKKALTGPIGVSIDLTRKCTLDCLMCWWRSPFFKQKYSSGWLNQELDYEILKRLLADLKKIQVKKIILGGQGDPLLYPKIIDAIQAIKGAGMELSIITSGAYFNEKKIKAIFDLEVDFIVVSLLAATEEGYLKIHPSQRQGLFEDIKKYLIVLSELKKTSDKKMPKVFIADAICKLNYRETVKIIELAKEVGAESVNFKRVDVTPETESLLLSGQELEELEVLLSEAEKRAVELGISNDIAAYREYALTGLITGVYTANLYSLIPCYVGWRSARILSDGNVIPCCGCYDIILGNINKTSFIDIWNSKEYRLFRGKSINIQKNNELSKQCKCYSCTDHTLNLAIYKKLHPIKGRRFLYV